MQAQSFFFLCKSKKQYNKEVSAHIQPALKSLLQNTDRSTPLKVESAAIFLDLRFLNQLA